jgi:hypothetical protein
MEAGAGAPYISRRSPDSVDSEFQQFAMHPRRAPVGIRLGHCGNQRADVSGHRWSPDPSAARPSHQSRKLRRCQADDGFRLDDHDAVRHPVQTRKSTTQSHRSAFASRNRRGLVRRSTCSWCRKASTSGWSATRDRAQVRRVRRSETNTDIIAQKRIHRRPQHQRPQRERPFQ